jgi:hypothetical protein
MHTRDCIYFAESADLTHDVLKLFIEYEITCAKAERVLRAKVKDRIKGYEKNQRRLKK